MERPNNDTIENGGTGGGGVVGSNLTSKGEGGRDVKTMTKSLLSKDAIMHKKIIQISVPLSIHSVTKYLDLTRAHLAGW